MAKIPLAITSLKGTIGPSSKSFTGSNTSIKFHKSLITNGLWRAARPKLLIANDL
jgi:hypothetical protein